MCPSGEFGSQTCNADQTGFGACSCVADSGVDAVVMDTQPPPDTMMSGPEPTAPEASVAEPSPDVVSVPEPGPEPMPDVVTDVVVPMDVEASIPPDITVIEVGPEPVGPEPVPEAGPEPVPEAGPEAGPDVVVDVPLDVSPTVCFGVGDGMPCPLGHCCGNQCVRNDAVETCGTSCRICETPSNGTATCDGRMCGVSCNANYAPSGNQCLPVPARPIAPLSGSQVFTARPELRWQLPAIPSAGARVEVCRDRACRTVEWSGDIAASSSITVGTMLTAGTWYWRVFGRDAVSTGTMSSPVWEFHVSSTRVSTRSTAGLSHGDFNGDGFSEVVVGDGTMRAFEVYAGSAMGVAATSPVRITSGVDAVVPAHGDINGDGYPDLIFAGTGDNALVIYRGSASGIMSAMPGLVPSPRMNAGGNKVYAVAFLGDVNGDGYGDVALSEGDSAGMVARRLHVYLGSFAGIRSTPSRSIDPPDTVAPRTAFADVIVGDGDLNGDGLADMVTSTWNFSADAGRVYVFYGAAAGIGATPSETLNAPRTAHRFGQLLAIPGDVNGNGVADLVVGETVAGIGADSSHAYFYPGQMTTGIPTTTGTTIENPVTTVSDGGIYTWLAPGGDLDGDGFADVLLGDGLKDRVYVHRGTLSGPAVIPSSTLTDPVAASPGRFGQMVNGLGDINGDGLSDFGALSLGGGQWYTYHGSASGAPTAPNGRFSLAGVSTLAWWNARSQRARFVSGI